MFRQPTTSTDDFPAFTSNVPLDELRLLDQLSTDVVVRGGTRLMTQGEFSRDVALVNRGELRVERDGEPVASVGPGGVVGELGVILDAPRNATVLAATDAEVKVMTTREFRAVLEHCPTISRQILTGAVAHAAA